MLTWANVLTLVRVPMAALLWWSTDPRWLVALLVAAGVSDVVDGRIARALRARRLTRGASPDRIADEAAVGAWLDPLCDKLFVVSMLVALWVNHEAPLAVVVLIAARELVVGPLTIVYRSSHRMRRAMTIDFRAGTLGKITTGGQYVAVAAVIVLPGAALPAAIVTAVVGIAASALYLVRALRGDGPHHAAPLHVAG